MLERRTAPRNLSVLPTIERHVGRLRPVDQWLYGVGSSVRSWMPSAIGGYGRQLDRIERLSSEMARLDDACLAAEAQRLRSRLLRDDAKGAGVERAFAIARETTHRRLGLRHHRVQMLGGLVMINGGFAEMRTGEGKTITALLPAATYALSGRPVHVVTVNEYLASRDAEQLRPVYEALGLTVGVVESNQSSELRRRAYEADVTYCTNKDLVFDYLRDRLASRDRQAQQRHRMLLRGLAFAVVDEADSVLIDEAQTPLILAEERPASSEDAPYAAALTYAQALREGRDFHIRRPGNQIELTDAGQRRLSDGTCLFQGSWRAPAARAELITNALGALHLYQKDRHYIVSDGKVQIVDEFTGRVMADRTWQLGLHQLIETKEGLQPGGQRNTLAQITYQRFFRRYLRLAGMSGTVREVAGEIGVVYGPIVQKVPTHQKNRCRNMGLSMTSSMSAKWLAVADAAERVASTGRPVLVGTRSVAASEAIATLLAKRTTPHVVLNARQDKFEAEAIAQAGQAGRITVATNMAGRGTDIHLAKGVAGRGGLHVILTEYHESARIDRQLIGRAGRQGDPGSYQVIASFDDEIFGRFAPSATRLARIVHAVIPARFIALTLRYLAQSTAERAGRRLRRRIVQRDQQLDQTLLFSGNPE